MVPESDFHLPSRELYLMRDELRREPVAFRALPLLPYFLAPLQAAPFPLPTLRDCANELKSSSTVKVCPTSERQRNATRSLD